jgi:hypothetical protein
VVDRARQPVYTVALLPDALLTDRIAAIYRAGVAVKAVNVEVAKHRAHVEQRVGFNHRLVVAKRVRVNREVTVVNGAVVAIVAHMVGGAVCRQTTRKCQVLVVQADAELRMAAVQSARVGVIALRLNYVRRIARITGDAVCRGLHVVTLACACVADWNQARIAAGRALRVVDARLAIRNGLVGAVVLRAVALGAHVAVDTLGVCGAALAALYLSEIAAFGCSVT